MKRTIIPLGGGCDGAMILQELGLRGQSYPFDWLWNLDIGLAHVSDMICSEFEHVQKRADYVWGQHDRWPDEKILIFRHYPEIAHIHTNPLDKPADLATYNRRIDKFLNLMRSAQPIVFLYYRHFESGKGTSSEADLLARLDLWKSESIDFMRMVRDKYPDKDMELLSVFQLPVEHLDHPMLKAKIDEILTQHEPSDIHFHMARPRSDTDAEAREQWSQDWRDLLKRHNLISPLDRFLIRPRRLKKKLVRHYRKHVKKMTDL